MKQYLSPLFRDLVHLVHPMHLKTFQQKYRKSLVLNCLHRYNISSIY